MKNFEVHELVNGYTAQCDSLEQALNFRDSLLLEDATYEVKITAEVDEDDL